LLVANSKPKITLSAAITLDGKTPLYYNSNILGRYMRKDYFKPQQ